jgi:hypothetical protein
MNSGNDSPGGASRSFSSCSPHFLFGSVPKEARLFVAPMKGARFPGDDLGSTFSLFGLRLVLGAEADRSVGAMFPISGAGGGAPSRLSMTGAGASCGAGEGAGDVSDGEAASCRGVTDGSTGSRRNSNAGATGVDTAPGARPGGPESLNARKMNSPTVETEAIAASANFAISPVKRGRIDRLDKTYSTGKPLRGRTAVINEPISIYRLAERGSARGLPADDPGDGR